MKYLRTLLLLARLLPDRTSAAPHSLGTIHVAVESNETLSMLTEFNYDSEYLRTRQRARAANVTVGEYIASQLVMEFEICFPDRFCPVVEDHVELFESSVLSEVCGAYCEQPRYHADLELLGVCEDRNSRHADGCIDFGLSVQASSLSEAEGIKGELGASLVRYKRTFENLLNELTDGEFEGDIHDPFISGYDISETPAETWFPAWHLGGESCTNDPDVPFYMRLDPDEYLAPSKTDCCRKHFFWNVRECAEPEEDPCPEGYLLAQDDVGWNPLMDGKYYGSYPNIMYPGW